MLIKQFQQENQNKFKQLQINQKEMMQKFQNNILKEVNVPIEEMNKKINEIKSQMNDIEYDINNPSNIKKKIKSKELVQKKRTMEENITRYQHTYFGYEYYQENKS